MRNRIRIARGTSAERTNTENLPAGVPIFETDTRKLYIGDDNTHINQLKGITAEEAEKLTQITLNGNGTATHTNISIGSPKNPVYFYDGLPKVGSVVSKSCNNLNKVCQMLDTIPINKILYLELTVPSPSIRFYTHTLRRNTTGVIEPVDSNTNIGSSTFKIDFLSGVPYDSNNPNQHRYYIFKIKESESNFSSTLFDADFIFGYNKDIYYAGYNYGQTGYYLEIRGRSWYLGVSGSGSDNFVTNGSISFTQYDSYYCDTATSYLDRYGDMNLSGTYTVYYYEEDGQ